MVTYSITHYYIVTTYTVHTIDGMYTCTVYVHIYMYRLYAAVNNL